LTNFLKIVKVAIGHKKLIRRCDMQEGEMIILAGFVGVMIIWLSKLFSGEIFREVGEKFAKGGSGILEGIALLGIPVIVGIIVYSMMKK
jgi:hypothetical protein